MSFDSFSEKMEWLYLRLPMILFIPIVLVVGVCFGLVAIFVPPKLWGEK